MNTEAKPIGRAPHTAGAHPTTIGRPGAGQADAGLFALLLSGTGDAGALFDTAPTSGGASHRNPPAAADLAAEDPLALLPSEQAQALLAQMAGATVGLARPDVPTALPAAQTSEAIPRGDRSSAQVGFAAPVLAGSGSTAGRGVDAAEPGQAGLLNGGTAPASGDSAPMNTGAAQTFHGSRHASAKHQGAAPQLGSTAVAVNTLSEPAGNARVDGLQRVWQAALEGQAPREPASTLLAGAAAPQSGQREREQERVSDRPWGTMQGVGMVDPSAATATLGTPASGAISATVNASVPDVAQQFQYWINADVQNAELHVDGMGGEPVQVQISLSGNEAQVVFRTDQAQTRELLGNALATLDQMLKAQGMALSGGWVGGSGAGRGQSGGHTGHYEGQAATGSAVVGVPASGLARATGLVSGRQTLGSVDCFA